MVLGQKCTLGNGNPFSDSPVIIDTKPQEGSTDVSVFTLPTVSYAFPINTELSFIDEKVGPRTFKLLIDQVSLKMRITTTINLSDFLTMTIISVTTSLIKYLRQDQTILYTSK